MFLLFFLCVTLLEVSDPIYKTITFAPSNLIDVQIPEITKSLNIDFLESAVTLKSVEFLGTNIIRIKDACFQCCEKLEKINLENCKKLRVIPMKCFEFCISLKSVSFPVSLKTISHSAFSNCISLESINMSFEHEIEYIQPYAFFNCSLTEFIIPNKILDLSHMSLSGNTKMTEFKIDKSTRYVIVDQFLYDITDESTMLAFYPMGLPNKTVVIPNFTRSIRGGAFYGAIYAEEFIFNESQLNSIEQFGFTCCTSLKVINFSQNSISFLGYSVFSNCTSLETVIFSIARCYIPGHSFAFNPSLKTVVLPRLIMALHDDAFYQSNNLEKIVCTYRIKNHLVKIGFDENLFELYTDLHVNIFSLNSTRTLYRGSYPIFNIHAADEFDDWKEISFSQPNRKHKKKGKRPKIHKK